MKILYRQGDVAIIEAPKNAKLGARVKREAGRVILAHGELTGHSHAIVSRDATLFQSPTADAAQVLGERILNARRTVSLTHEEHGPIKIPAGKYTIRIQREYAPEELRSVLD